MLPALAVGAVYGITKLASSYDQKSRALAEQEAHLARHNPTSNRYDPPSTIALMTDAQPVRVMPDRDVRGVPTYMVDYGSGALHRQYTTPQFYAGKHSYP